MHSGIMNCTPCLSLWERCLSEAKTERVNEGVKPSQSPAVTALPEGEPRGFNASLMLALPEGNRGALLGFISAASTGGCALSAVIFGVLGDVSPLYLVFTVGCLLTILPMAYMSLHKNAREFVLTH